MSAITQSSDVQLTAATATEASVAKTRKSSTSAKAKQRQEGTKQPAPSDASQPTAEGPTSASVSAAGASVTSAAESTSAPVVSMISPYTCINVRGESSYTVVRKIGSGAYGKVYAAWKKTGSTTLATAIKMPIRISGSTIFGLSVLKEVDILSRCNHPYILKLHRVESDLYNTLRSTSAAATASSSSAATANAAPGDEQMLRIRDAHNAISKAKYDRISMVFELAIANTEDTRIHDLGEEKLRLCMAECLLALEYMHVKRIVHRDLKPSNILLCVNEPSSEVIQRYMENQHPQSISSKQFASNKQFLSRFLAEPTNTCLKICDFGLSKICNNYLHTRGVVTLWYRAPEIAEAPTGEKATRYSHASDWWSFGCILYEWVTGTPFSACSTSGDDEEQDRNLLDLIRTNLARLDKNNWDVVHTSLKARSNFTRSEKNCIANLIKSFLRLEPSERMSPTSALDASVFQPLRSKIVQDRLRLPHVEYCGSTTQVEPEMQPELDGGAGSSSAAAVPAGSSSDMTVPADSSLDRRDHGPSVTLHAISKTPVTKDFVLTHAFRAHSTDATEALLDQIQQYREHVYLFALELYRTQWERRYYHTNRRLFLALELFDRFCLWLLTKRTPNRLLQTFGVGCSGESTGVTNAERLGVLFLMMYYMSIKYLSSFEPSVSLKNLLTRRIQTDRNFNAGVLEELELFLFTEVFHYQVGPNRVVKRLDCPESAALSSMGKTVPKSRKKRLELIYLNPYEALCAQNENFDEASTLSFHLTRWKHRSSFFEFVKLFTPSA